MALNFPSSPAIGQKFDSGTVRYIWDGTTWNATQLGTALPFNYIVNGSMQVSQQNGDVVSSVNAYYPADQWVVSLSGISTNLQRQGFRLPLTGSQYKLYMPVNAPSVKPTLGATDYYLIGTGLEGNRVTSLEWGTAKAKQVVLRFYLQSTVAGTFGGGFRNAAANRSYVFQYTISTINQFVEYSVVIPGDVTGVWPKDNTPHAINFYFCFGCGYTALISTPGVWAAGSLLAPTGITNGFATGNTFQLADVGLYMDPDLTGRAPPHLLVDEGQAHMDALRHWHKSQGGCGIGVATTAVGRLGTQHTVQMRAGGALSIVGPPTIYDQGVNTNLLGVTTSYANPFNDEIDGSTAAATNLGRAAIQDQAVGGTLYSANNAR